MASAEGLKIYKEHTATAETVNADPKTWRGMAAWWCAASARC
jgi:hypothetical protein